MKKSLKDLENQIKKVSFVVPIYKTERYLKKCFDSLVQQDYKNFEVIAIADGPSPKGKQIFNTFAKKDKRFKKYVTVKHSGAPRARNEGYKYTSGDYVSFWDSDCYAEPGMVRMWVKVFLMFPDISFVYSGYRFTNGDFIGTNPFDKYLLTCNNYIATMFPMKREIFPGFDEGLESLQDWDMWLTLSEKGYKGRSLEGSGFTTEIRKGISSEGCSDEKWLTRYEKVRSKHSIFNRDICFASALWNYRAKEIAEICGQDYAVRPGFHPNRYKIVYNIGFYSGSMEQSSEIFTGLEKTCKKYLHWMGDDIESIFMMPYQTVKSMGKLLKDTIDKHFCEDEQTRKMLEELGIEAKIMPLPMEYKKVKPNKDFLVYYEFDQPNKALVDSIIKALPHIKFVSIPDSQIGIKLKDISLYLSVLNSNIPTENLKKFRASGRYVITTQQGLFSNYTPIDKVKLIEKILKVKDMWNKGINEPIATEHYKKLINPKTFKENILNELA